MKPMMANPAMMKEMLDKERKSSLLLSFVLPIAVAIAIFWNSKVRKSNQSHRAKSS